MSFRILHLKIVVSSITNRCFPAFNSTALKILAQLGGISCLKANRLHCINWLRGITRHKLYLLKRADRKARCRSHWTETALAALRQTQSLSVEFSRWIEIGNMQTNKGNP